MPTRYEDARSRSRSQSVQPESDGLQANEGVEKVFRDIAPVMSVLQDLAC